MSARVLVVDDVLPNVKLLEAKLTREYFDVLTANDGPQALKVVREEMPDIVLLDVMMPGMDGFQVCEQIKSDPATVHIPVIMVTALSESSDRVRGLEAGADEFLTKPVNDMELFARVRSLVRLKMMMDEWRLRESTSSALGVMSPAPSPIDESPEAARVLVIEDSRIDLKRITETLERDRSVVAWRSGGQDAIDEACNGDYDLIVLSLTLQGEDGLRLCSNLRSQDRLRQVPILLLADEADLDRTTKGLELGAHDYLIKPIDRNELLARARTQIKRKRFQDKLRSNYEASLSMALTDSLTGLYNRRYLMAHLERMLERQQETRKPVIAVMCDIDRFKAINDTYGHPIGDEILVELAGRLKDDLRSFDLVARLGGEEFVVVMPEISVADGLRVAERLCRDVAERPFRISADPGQLDITISMGVATSEGTSMMAFDLLRNADKALYTAKDRGRNQVVLFTGEDAAEGVIPEDAPLYNRSVS